MKYLFLILCIAPLIFSCAKDQQQDEFRKQQIQANINLMSPITGVYTGNLISVIDNSNLGLVTLNLATQTTPQNSTISVNMEQSISISGTLTYQGLNNVQVKFKNAFYDSTTGSFQANANIVSTTKDTQELILQGTLQDGRFDGKIEILGQSDYGGKLNLKKNAPINNNSALTIGGARIEQLSKSNKVYVGSYKLDEELFSSSLTITSKELTADQQFVKILNPERDVKLILDFTETQFIYQSAILNEKLGTIIATDPIDQNGVPTIANLNCRSFVSGWDCSIKTKKQELFFQFTAK